MLDISAASSADGAKAQAYESNDTLAQRFEVSLNEDGSFRIRTAASGGFLTQSSANSTDVVQRGNHTTAAVDMNTWKLVWQGGYYTVVRADTASSSAAGQKALSLEGTQNGKALKVASNTGSYDLKHFLFEQASLINDGLYEIVSRLGLDLDAAGAGATSGTNVQIYEKNNSVAQKYYVTSAGGGYYAITCGSPTGRTPSAGPSSSPTAAASPSSTRRRARRSTSWPPTRATAPTSSPSSGTTPTPRPGACPRPTFPAG